MKYISIILITLLLAVSCADKQTYEPSDRFWDSLLDANEIGKLEQLTDDGRFIYPFFAQNDSMLVFKRLFAADAETAANLKDKPIAAIMGMNINNKDIYKLSDYPMYPTVELYQGDLIPAPLYEQITFVIQSPDSSVLAFETIINEETQQRAIYLAKGDSVSQLSYGEISCSLNRFSNSGRYLTAVIGGEATWILIYDLTSGKIYKIENPENRFDYMTAFSSDDKMIAFIRSEKLISNAGDYFGDIWLFKFKE